MRLQLRMPVSSPLNRDLFGRPVLRTPRPRGVRDEKHRQTVVVAVVFVVLVFVETAARLPPQEARVVSVAEQAFRRGIMLRKNRVSDAVLMTVITTKVNRAV